MILIVRNIDRAVTQAEMHAMLARYGQVTSFDLVIDKDTGASKGFGFASMPNDRQAQLAITQLDGRAVNGSELRVKRAAPSSLKKYNRQNPAAGYSPAPAPRSRPRPPRSSERRSTPADLSLKNPTQPPMAAVVRSKALAHLRKVSPEMKSLIRRIGACGLEVEPRTPFQALVSAIAHQQLHGKAAMTILGRFYAYFGDRMPQPEEVLLLEDAQFRAAGFSGSKTAALRDLAAKTREGIVPELEEISGLSDREIIERLTQVRGVGKWTVEMMLIFTLGRPDVWPVDDFGVRLGWKKIHGLEEMPKPKELEAAGEILRPHRSTAAWYLWRAADEK